MKKFLLTLGLIISISFAYSQTTYYWVAGSSPRTFTNAARWNTQLNGSGTTRATADTTDILVIDGTNIGGATPATGTVNATMSSTKIGQLKLINNATVVFSRPTGGTAGTLTITGGAGDDLIVAAGSSLSLDSRADSGAVNIALNDVVTGFISGNFTITNTSTSRITAKATGAIVFTSTAICTLSSTPAATAYPFGSATQGFEKGIVFQSGSKLYQSGTYSPMGGTSTYQAIDFQSGSNYYVRATNALSTGTWLTRKSFSNVFVQNNSVFTAEGAIYKIDNLTIESGSTFITHTSGQVPVLGNLVVDGSINYPVAGSTCQLVMGGNSPQTISGSGTIRVPQFIVADKSDVTLNSNVTADSSTSIYGKINFGATNKVNGTGSFTARVADTAATLTGNTVAGSYQITGVVGVLGGNVGLTITGTGIQSNTNVVGTSTGSAYINLSKPATATGTVSLTFLGGAATLITSNPNGFDSTSGSVTVAGAKSFRAGTNYVVNTATTNPIGISSGATVQTVGNLTLNAATTTNTKTNIKGSLLLNSGKLTVRSVDTLRVLNTGSIDGAPFSNAKYIVTEVNGANVGTVRMDSFTTAKLFPIGNAANYLPATLTPTAYMDLTANVFTGATVDGTPNGTAATLAQKANVVDAVWNVGRIIGAGDCNVAFGWASSLEGAAFTGFSNAQIGVAHYDGAAWNTTIGSGDNATNTANATFNTFSPFMVGELGVTILPLKLVSFTASVDNNNVAVKWDVKSENEIVKYTIERSSNGISFEKVGTVLPKFNGAENNSYSFADNNLATGTYSYRLAYTDKSGNTKYSNILRVAINSKIAISSYPNPVKNVVNLTGVQKNDIIKITSINGSVVAAVKSIANTSSISTENFASGNYIVTVERNNNTVATLNIVK